MLRELVFRQLVLWLFVVPAATILIVLKVLIVFFLGPLGPLRQ